METCQSPWTVLRVAHYIGKRLFPDHLSPFSRHDFTLAQLFACLVVREFYGLSYRRTEKLLRDSPLWLADIGMSAAPDHNTLWRAFGIILKGGRAGRLLDLAVACFDRTRRLRLRDRPLAMDSTCFEQHHRSMHYHRRCRQMRAGRRGKNGKSPEKPGSWGKSVNASRKRTMTTMPKLSVAVASACHLIVAAKVRTGYGSDAPDFGPLLRKSDRRVKVKTVVADAGYDSEENHRLAREEMGVRSIIPTGIGRPTEKLPRGRWRRNMARRFARKADQKAYGQRSQSETVHSMMKRNLGSALRSRTPERRKQEMMLRVITHNIMLLCNEENEE
jgi:IS5 family transposase